MFKKLILISSVTLAVCFAGFEDDVKALIKKETGIDVSVVSVTDFKDAKNLKLVVVEQTGNLQQLPAIVTSDAKMFMGLSNIFFTSSSADGEIVGKAIGEVMKNNDASKKRAAGKLIDKLDSSEYISLTGKSKNAKTYFIVSDPNCGYCREELRNLEDKLKTHNVNMVVVGILSEDSKKRAAYIMNNITNTMSNDEKIKIIKEVYSNNFKAPKNIDTSAIEKTVETLFSNGVLTGVPFIYEK